MCGSIKLSAKKWASAGFTTQYFTLYDPSGAFSSSQVAVEIKLTISLLDSI
jgi:hypothetical protein